MWSIDITMLRIWVSVDKDVPLDEDGEVTARLRICGGFLRIFEFCYGAKKLTRVQRFSLDIY